MSVLKSSHFDATEMFATRLPSLPPSLSPSPLSPPPPSLSPSLPSSFPSSPLCVVACSSLKYLLCIQLGGNLPKASSYQVPQACATFSFRKSKGLVYITHSTWLTLVCVHYMYIYVYVRVYTCTESTHLHVYTYMYVY